MVYLDDHKINRMRNLHDSISTHIYDVSKGREFGLENVLRAILRKWEQLEKKIADFRCES